MSSPSSPKPLGSGHLRERGRSRAAAALAFALPASVPAAMLLVAFLTVRMRTGTASAAETLFLALWAAAVFLPLAFLAEARRPPYAALALAVGALISVLPGTGGLRPVVVASLLAATVSILAALSFVRRTAISLRTSAALALAAAVVLYGHRLFRDGLSLPNLVLIGLLPAIAAAVSTRLAASGRAGAGLAVALALLFARELASEPWWIGLAFLAAAVAASFAAGRLQRAAGGFLLVFAAATLLAGGFPWLRRAPVATLLSAATAVDRQVSETPLRERVAVLTQAAPRFDFELSGAPIRSLVFDSYLTHGVDLPCGRALAEITVAERAPGPAGLSEGWRATLVVGRDSAEWAAARPDVAARLACAAPPPWISWIPSAGRFLGQTTRARFALPKRLLARRLTLERAAALPAETSLALFFAATER